MLVGLTMLRFVWTNVVILSALKGCLAIGGDYGAAHYVGDNQIYIGKTPRFIKFDTKDNEVEIELGISIPVVKIPLAPEVGRHGQESGISVSAPGLVVAGVLILTTFLIVPLLFSTKTYKDLRSGKIGDSENVWDSIRADVYDNFVNSSNCMESLICWTARTSKNGVDGSLGKWMDGVFRSEWMERLANGTFVQRAILNGRKGSQCWSKYQNCSIARKLSAILHENRSP